MRLVIKLFRIARHDCVLYVVDDAQTHEVVVPHYVVRDHEEAHETLGEEELTFLVIGGGE